MEKLPDYVRIMRDSYKEVVDWNIRQSTMDSGYKKQMPGRTKPIRTRQAKLIINGKNNKTSFEGWLGLIGGGTQYFTYDDPINGSMKCRFVNTTWEFELTGLDHWTSTCEIESI